MSVSSLLDIAGDLSDLDLLDADLVGVDETPALPLGTRVQDQRRAPAGVPGRLGKVRTKFSTFPMPQSQVAVAWDGGVNEEGVESKDLKVVLADAKPGPAAQGIVLQGPEQVGRGLKIAGRFLSALLLGTAAATVGGAVLWKEHRVLGGLLGLVVVGPAAGAGAGYALTYADAKKLKADALAAQQKQLPATAASSGPRGTP